MAEPKETCLKTNGEQTVKLRSGSIRFKNYFKQPAAPFKIYADFECYVRVVLYRGKNLKCIYSLKQFLGSVIIAKK